MGEELYTSWFAQLRPKPRNYAVPMFPSLTLSSVTPFAVAMPHAARADYVHLRSMPAPVKFQLFLFCSIMDPFRRGLRPVHHQVSLTTTTHVILCTNSSLPSVRSPWCSDLKILTAHPRYLFTSLAVTSDSHTILRQALPHPFQDGTCTIAYDWISAPPPGRLNQTNLSRPCRTHLSRTLRCIDRR